MSEMKLNRVHVYRIIDSALLLFLAFWTYKAGTELLELQIGLFLPIAILLLAGNTPGVFLRVLAFAGLLFTFTYTPGTQIVIWTLLFLVGTAFLFRPPVYFLRTTVYSYWMVVLFLYWQHNGTMFDGWEFVLLDEILSMKENMLYVLLLGYFSGLYLNLFERGYQSRNLYTLIMGIAGIAFLIPANVIVGLLVGLYQSFYLYWVTLLSTVKIRSRYAGNKYEHYLAHTGWNNWKEVWSGVFQAIGKSNGQWKRDMKSCFASYGRIIAFYYCAMKLAAMLILSAAGSVIHVLFSFLHLMILGIFMFIYHFIRSGFYYADRAYRKMNRINMICPSCHHKDELPVYVCPSCNSSHDDLKPGKYGIFKRKCMCGHKLPASVLNGRSELPACCPRCQAVHTGNESTTIAVPILGGKMAGKTSFWTMGLEQLNKEILASKEISLEWDSAAQSAEFQQRVHRIRTNMSVGQTAALVPEAWTFKLESKKWARRKMVYLYDPSGAAFERSDMMKKMEYLSFADGMILVIDSAFLTGNHAAGHFEQRQTNGISPEEIIDRLLLYYQEELGIKVHEKITTPLAIVVHKADAGFMPQAANEVSAAQDHSNDSHEACKQWLQVNGSHNLLRKLEHQFTTYRFFTSSVLAESEQTKPAHALAWIMSLSDKGLKDLEKGGA
jgi:hypothetical protein